MKQLLIVLFSLLLAMPTFADTAGHSRIQTEEFRFHYRFDKAGIDLDYLDNSRTAELLKASLQNPSRLDSIVLYVCSSPDGVYAYNARLARQRAAAAQQYILGILGGTEGNANSIASKIRTVTIAENWQGLLSLVEESYTRHDREKVIRILRTENITEATRKWRLQQLDEGYTWNYMLRHYMPQLRNATVICLRMKKEDPLPRILQMCAKAVTDQGRPIAVLNYAEPVTDQPSPVQHAVTPKADQPAKPDWTAKTGQAQPMTALWALRTNLLVPALNIGAEIPIGNSWSVSADYYFPWIWPNKVNRNCFELLGWSVEGRYWFGRDRQPQQRLRGHSVGLYAAGGYYDLEWNYKGQQGEFVSTGLDYTYAMAVGQRKRLNLEFTLAVGYIRSWGRNYNVPGANGELYPEPGTVIFDYIGPTKAAVSLVVPFEKWPWDALKARAAKSKSEKEGRR